MSAAAIDLQPYASLNDEDCDKRIIRAREALGDRVVILGHHYQRDEIFKHADFSGDSLKLSRQAADSKAEYIVFCGVHFMAEVADTISRPQQVSILPDLSAGYSMAGWNRTEPGQSIAPDAGQRKQDDTVHVAHVVPVLDHVSHRSPAPRLGA